MRKMLVIAVLAAMVALAAACGGGSTAPKEETAVSTATPKASFTVDEIVLLTEQQLSSGTDNPIGTKTISCFSAEFLPTPDMWAVSCSFYSDQEGSQIITTRTYPVSDKDGKLVKQTPTQEAGRQQ